MHHATIFLSDLHLGTRYCKTQRLLEFFKFHSASQYYFIGDIIDTWNMGKDWYMDDDQKAIIKYINNIWNKSYILAGNHDETNITILADTFPNNNILEACVHYTLNNTKLLVVHGHQFDSSLLRASSDFHFSLAMVINRWYHSKTKIRSSIGKVAYNLFGNPRMSKFYGNIQTTLHSTDYQGVICGHIHKPDIKLLNNGVQYFNCGDWITSCSALIEELDGTMRIYNDRLNLL